MTSPSSTIASSQLPQLMVEPNYQSIPTSGSQNTSPAMIEPNYQSVPSPGQTSPSVVPAPAAGNPPAIIYQVCIIIYYSGPSIIRIPLAKPIP